MHTRSLRLRLSLTYAGMALLTAVILGGILLAVLGNHYARAEDDYLQASAKLVVADPPPLTTVEDLTSWSQAAALTTQTRVQVYGRDGTLVVDSGHRTGSTPSRCFTAVTASTASATSATACPTHSAAASSAAPATRARAAASPWTWATAPTSSSRRARPPAATPW